MKLNKLFFIFLLLSQNIYSKPYVVVTESIPPYQDLNEGIVSGTVTNIVRDTLKCAKLDAKFMLLPWKRAFDMAVKDKDTLIYSMARTPDREKQFHWIGPVLQTSINLYKLKSRTDIEVNNFEDIKNYQLGLLRGGFIVDLFINKGFKLGQHFRLNANNESRVNMLFAGRYDLIDALDIQLDKLLNKTSHPYSSLEKLLPIATNEELYLAINKSADKELVTTLKHCLSQLKPIISE